MAAQVGCVLATYRAAGFIAAYHSQPAFDAVAAELVAAGELAP